MTKERKKSLKDDEVILDPELREEAEETVEEIVPKTSVLKARISNKKVRDNFTRKTIPPCNTEGQIPVRVDAKTIVYAKNKEDLKRIKIKYNL